MIPEKEGDSVGALSYWPDAALQKGIERTKKKIQIEFNNVSFIGC